jgi:hypothetical protein
MQQCTFFDKVQQCTYKQSNTTEIIKLPDNIAPLYGFFLKHLPLCMEAQSTSEPSRHQADLIQSERATIELVLGIEMKTQEDTMRSASLIIFLRKMPLVAR